MKLFIYDMINFFSTYNDEIIYALNLMIAYLWYNAMVKNRSYLNQLGLHLVQTMLFKMCQQYIELPVLKKVYKELFLEEFHASQEIKEAKVQIRRKIKVGIY